MNANPRRTGLDDGQREALSRADAALSPPKPCLEGNIDTVSRDGLISGWCWYPMQPATRVQLSVAVDGATVGSTSASTFRPDLQQAGIGDGCHGFNFALPWSLLEEVGRLTIVLADSLTGEQLADPVVMRLGKLSRTEDRVADMERQIRRLRFEVESLTAELDRRERAGPAPDIFATLGALFSELSATPTPRATLAHAAPDLSLSHALAQLEHRHGRLTLAIAPHPIATIAIPAEADLASVHRCLTSLHQSGLDRIAEIVLLDGDRTPSDMMLLPALVRNLRIVPHEPGRALLSTLATLAIADRPLVYLSPHLRPEPDWLDRLIATLVREPEAGLVSGRVVGQDGLLRHGGLLADDQDRPASFGAMDNAARPEFGFLRAVEAVGALGFAVRGELVQAIAHADGMEFDPGLAVLDLCLRLRKIGHQILVQPTATALCDDAVDISQREANLPLPQPVASTLVDAWQARTRIPPYVGHALVIDTIIPSHDRDAGSLATLEHLQILRGLGYRVTFAATQGIAPDDPQALHLEGLGIELVRQPEAASITAYLLKHGAWLDLVQIWRHTNAGPFLERVRSLAPRARLIFSPADLHHVREARRAELTGGNAAMATDIRNQELLCASAADVTIVHSDMEFDLLRAGLGPEFDRNRLRLLRWIARPIAAPSNFAARSGICFLGSFAHTPNQDGLRWFLTAILPHLRANEISADAPIQLHIAGPDLPSELAAEIAALADPNIVVHGWVEDLAKLFSNIRLSVAPLRYGAGFKGKIATSLSFGVPVIATAIAAEGTGLHDGEGIIVADGALAFAKAIIRLHTTKSMWCEQAQRTVERCRALYSPDAAIDVYQKILDYKKTMAGL